MRNLALLVTVLTTLACGGMTQSAQDELTEELTERIIEAAAGEDIDIDIDEGTGTVTVAGQTFTADEKTGTFSVSGDDGEMQATFGDQATLPAGWPVAPDGGTVVGTMNAQTDEGEMKTVIFQAPGTVEEHARALEAKLAALPTADKLTTLDDQDGAALQLTTHDQVTWHVQISPEDDQVNIIVGQLTGGLSVDAE